MHDILRERLARQIDALPDEQLYQVLDYIEFLNSKYARGGVKSPGSAVQRFGEKLEDRLRLNRVGMDAIRSTLNVVGAADRVVSGLAEAGRSILREVSPEPISEQRPQTALPRSGSTPTAPREGAGRPADMMVDDSD